jgi:O-antigen/teichoic acid export membrane protein
VRSNNTHREQPVADGDAAGTAPVLGASHRRILKRWAGTGVRFVLGSTARKGGLALADQAVASATNFVTGAIVGRTVAREKFGLYTLGFTLALLALNVQNALVSAPYTVYSPRLKGSDHARYTGSTLLHQWGLTALCVALLLLVGAALSAGVGPMELAPLAWALAVAIPFILLREYARSVCFAGLRMGSALVLDSCVAAVQIGALLALARLGLLSESRAFLTVGVACGLAGIAWIVAARKLFILRLSRAVQDFKQNWSLGRWVLGKAAAWHVSSGLFPWLLAALRGAGAAGVFAACCGVVMLANPFLAAMTNLLQPVAAHAAAQGGRQRLGDVVLKSSAVVFACMSVFLVVMLLWGGWLVAVIYGRQYAGHGLVVSLVALSFFIRSFVVPVDAGLLARERPQVMMNSNLAGGVVALVLGTPMVWLYGLEGAALADVLSSAVANGIRIRSFWVDVVRQAEAP